MIGHRQTHFERLYRTDPDPWNYATSPYEQRKYAATLAGLQSPRYASAIEVGCSIGVLSARLRHRCDRYLGLDLSPTALALAKRRLAHYHNVALRQVEVPRHWPRRRADLIVLSEILYYLCPAELSVLARHIDRSLVSGGEVVIVAWRSDTATALSGPTATRLFTRALHGLRPFRRLIHASSDSYLHHSLICQPDPQRRTIPPSAVKLSGCAQGYVMSSNAMRPSSFQRAT
ncbi:SAM-dependent methyltransferase [Pararhodobacter sp. SW119]|uniref:class I SAM-dependent DNA methyltransferase n=1 Tax=Pararhodobacter sp. SW119 TaxID=2780075 RepID=UPI001ADEFFE8|nr:SAM-dependent methyltransferase [Pararhodobacter sp. SW119]